MIDFYKIVKKLWNKRGKVILKEDIFEIIDPEKKPEYSSKLNKIIYRLKSEKVIISLKSGVYIVPNEEDNTMNEVDLIEKYYLQLLKRYITYFVGSQYYISGEKALQIHMKDLSIPEKIFIVNRNINKKVKVGNYEIIFKTLAWKSQGKKINLYARFSELTCIKKMEDFEFKVANLELALIESGLVTDSELGINVNLLTRAIKKYSKFFVYENFEAIGKYKYIMSFNRIKELSKPLSLDMYVCCLKVIKENWGLFIGEWLRRI